MQSRSTLAIGLGVTVNLVLVAVLAVTLEVAFPATVQSDEDSPDRLLIDEFATSSIATTSSQWAWDHCCQSTSTIPDVILSVESDGMSGPALALDYDLSNGDWVVVLRKLEKPLDLSTSTHIRIAIKGSDVKAEHNFEFKLVDSSGGLSAVVQTNATNLPEWRWIYIDLRLFSSTNLSDIVQLEIGITRCFRQNQLDEKVACNPDKDIKFAGKLFVDELEAINLKPGSELRKIQNKFETVTIDPDLRASTAEAILAHQSTSTDLVPAWFDEDTANYNTYVEALSMMVWLEEFSRTNDLKFKVAVVKLADRLLDMQVTTTKKNVGAWFTAYVASTTNELTEIVPMDDSCTGNETVVKDIDRCMWIGNVAWAVIALSELQNHGVYSDPQKLKAHIDLATDWIERQIGRIDEDGVRELISVGLEGNISAYFALRAAGMHVTSTDLANAILDRGWDKTLERMKMGAGSMDFGTAMDTAGSWGPTLLRCMGKGNEALLSQGYAASVLRTESFDGEVWGYGDIAGPWTMTVEFGAQGAAAGILEADAVMNQIYTLQYTDGSFPGGKDNWSGGVHEPWTTTWTGVAPTAWVYFAQNGDPLWKMCKLPPDKVPSLSVAGIIALMGLFVVLSSRIILSRIAGGRN